LRSYLFGNLYDKEKSVPTEKRAFFLFQVFDLRFFTKFLFYYSVWIRIRIQIRTSFRIRIQPKKSDYFGFGSTTLSVIKVNGALYVLLDGIGLLVTHESLSICRESRSANVSSSRRIWNLISKLVLFLYNFLYKQGQGWWEAGGGSKMNSSIEESGNYLFYTGCCRFSNKFYYW
jgi:hypothetical protein